MDYRQITTDRQFKDSTGYSRVNFLALLSDYELTYEELDFMNEVKKRGVHLFGFLPFRKLFYG